MTQRDDNQTIDSIRKALALDLREFARDMFSITIRVVIIAKVLVLTAACGDSTAIVTAVTVVGVRVVGSNTDTWMKRTTMVASKKLAGRKWI